MFYQVKTCQFGHETCPYLKSRFQNGEISFHQIYHLLSQTGTNLGRLQSIKQTLKLEINNCTHTLVGIDHCIPSCG